MFLVLPGVLKWSIWYNNMHFSGLGMRMNYAWTSDTWICLLLWLTSQIQHDCLYVIMIILAHLFDEKTLTCQLPLFVDRWPSKFQFTTFTTFFNHSFHLQVAFDLHMLQEWSICRLHLHMNVGYTWICVRPWFVVGWHSGWHSLTDTGKD